MDIAYQAPYLNGLLNILSILLGIAALGFAIHAFQVKGCLICCTVSLGGCGLALLAQLLELARLSRIDDWAAIQDTIDSRAGAAAVLLVCTLALNIFALLRGRKGKQPDCESGC